MTVAFYFIVNALYINKFPITNTLLAHGQDVPFLHTQVSKRIIPYNFIFKAYKIRKKANERSLVKF